MFALGMRIIRMKYADYPHPNGHHYCAPLKLVKIQKPYFAGMIKQLRTQMADMAVIDMSITSIRHHNHILNTNIVELS